LPDSILYPGKTPGAILVVDKTLQELRIYRHDGAGRIVLEKVIPCSTGMVRGDKLIRGDKKTPDGYYVFNQKLLSSELPDIYGVLAYPMDYPNFWDQRVGRKGDGIWTHGVNKPLVDYDSNGCVELFNHDIAALEDIIELYDTPILLYEELKYRPASELKREGERVLAFVELWRKAWAEKDLEGYASMYSRDFYNNSNMSYNAWMTHKRNVASSYSKIVVSLEDLRAFRHRDVTVVSFVQRYQGDGRYSSVGLKRLYLIPHGDSYRIAAEEFLGSPRPPTGKRLSPEEKYAALTTPPLSVASFSKPVMTASAGAIIPAPELLYADAGKTSQDSAQDSSQDETERAAIEARMRGESPQADSKASIEDDETPLLVASLTPPAAPAGAAGGSSPRTVQGPSSVTGVLLGPDNAGAEGSSKASPLLGAEAPASAVASAPAIASPASSPPSSPSSSSGGDEAILLGLLASWEKAWESKDESGFFAHYAESFRFPDKGLDRKGFVGYRGRLMKSASVIEVELKDPKVKIEGDRATVKFSQKYRSDNYRDSGIKTLAFAKDGAGEWKITEESFINSKS
jgi:murein L,D-transpeptidase YafK